MKFELTIKTTYMPEWGIWEGLRELAQNGRDAEVEFDAPLTVRHRKESMVLVIENDGCVLPYEALLLGHTSKTTRPDLIGKFGEGLKLGILALVRAGCEIKIRSGSEVWVPSIQRSEKFKADVLTFEIQKGREPKQRVAIEISNVSEEAYEALKKKLLFLPGSVKDDEQVRTPNGSLLLGERFRGNVYVKGIYVATDTRLSYGYDFVDADIDRDRRMLSKYDLDYRTQTVWREALALRPDLVENFGKLLDQEAADVEGLDDWSASYLPEAAKAALVQTFRTRHGEDALPVQSLADSAEIEHLGKKGIITPKALRAVLEKELGNVAVNKLKLREEQIKAYGWHELEAAEKGHIQAAIALIAQVEPITLDAVDVVDFRDEGIRGMFKDGRVQLAKKILVDRDLTLRVMVHEVAHKAGGGDGEKSHVSNIERIWSGIVSALMPKGAVN